MICVFSSVEGNGLTPLMLSKSLRRASPRFLLAFGAPHSRHARGRLSGVLGQAVAVLRHGYGGSAKVQSNGTHRRIAPGGHHRRPIWQYRRSIEKHSRRAVMAGVREGRYPRRAPLGDDDIRSWAIRLAIYIHGRPSGSFRAASAASRPRLAASGFVPVAPRAGARGGHRRRCAT